MKHVLNKETNEWFADYMDRVGNDMEEGGRSATADDYHMAADRIRKLATKEHKFSIAPSTDSDNNCVHGISNDANCGHCEQERFDPIMEFGGHYLDWKASGNEWLTEIAAAIDEFGLKIEEFDDAGDDCLWRIVPDEPSAEAIMDSISQIAVAPSTIFTRGKELEEKGYIFNLAVSRNAGCGDVYIHPDGSLIQLCDIGDGSGLSEQKFISLEEYRNG